MGEAAFLAGVPQRPERHSPHKNPEAAKNRQMYVLRQMVEHRYLDKATADKLAKQPIEVLPPSRARDRLCRRGAEHRLPAAGGEIRGRGHPRAGRRREDHDRSRACRSRRARRWSGGWRAWTSGRVIGARRATIDGPKLAQYRYELKLARDIGRGGDEGKQAAAAAAKSKRPLRFNLRPIRDADIFEGVVDRVVKDSDAEAGLAGGGHRRSDGHGRPRPGGALHPHRQAAARPLPPRRSGARAAGARAPAGTGSRPRRRRWPWSWGPRRPWW